MKKLAVTILLNLLFKIAHFHQETIYSIFLRLYDGKVNKFLLIPRDFQLLKKVRTYLLQPEKQSNNSEQLKFFFRQKNVSGTLLKPMRDFYRELQEDIFTEFCLQLPLA